MKTKMIISASLLLFGTSCSTDQIAFLTHVMKVHKTHVVPICTKKDSWAPCKSHGDNEPIVPLENHVP